MRILKLHALNNLMSYMGNKAQTHEKYRINIKFMFRWQCYEVITPLKGNEHLQSKLLKICITEFRQKKYLIASLTWKSHTGAMAC